MCNLKQIITILALSLSLLSCNKLVRDDRQDCPCILTLDLTQVNTNIDKLHLWFFGRNGEIIYRDTIGSERYRRGYEIGITREMVDYFVWGNIKGATELNDNLTLNSSLSKVLNRSADSLYFFTNLLNTNAEFTRDTVLLNKEFITVDVNLKGEIKTGAEVEIELQGNSAGFYVDKRFLSGLGKVVAKCIASDKESSCFTYRITRQETLSNLDMRIVTERAGSKIELASFPLGNWLNKNGYAMQAKNLSDINIILDLASSFITISVDNWSFTTPVNIEF